MSEYPCLPPITDHAFMRLVRERCKNMDRSMAEIAEELGCNVDDLCRWIMAYKAPKPHKSVDNSKYGPAIAVDGNQIRSHRVMARQFEAWRKSQAGASSTLRMLERSSL